MTSLRFRLPALVLAAIALAGVVSIAISVRLFQDYAHDQALGELKREAVGIADLYTQQANIALEQGKQVVPVNAARLERATGDKLYYIGGNAVPGGGHGG